MEAELYWIEGAGCRLGIMPHPRGDDWLADEIRSLKDQGVEIIVSLLTAGEVLELGLEQEQAICAIQSVQFVSFPIRDHSLPDDRVAFVLQMGEILEALEDDKSVAIHCQAGIGRSGLTACYLLCMRGMSPAEAFDLISRSRRREVPDTAEQRAWITGLIAETRI